MASKHRLGGTAKAQGRPCHLSIHGWRLESRGIRDGPIHRSDLPVRRRNSDMTSYDDRPRSKTPSASGCTRSPSRKVDHCGRDSLHDRFGTRHRVRRISTILDPVNTRNAEGAIRKSSLARTPELPVRKYVHSVVCHGNEQKYLQTGGPRKVPCNLFPFHADPVWQWHEGRKHASAR